MSKHWSPRTVPERRHSYRNGGRRRRRRGFGGGVRLAVLAGLFASILYIFFPPAEATSPASEEASIPGDGTRVEDPWAVRITDGDTFRYRGEKIRIADIDTPEVQGRCPEETRLAARATERMAALLHQGPFEMRPIGSRDEDRYGRKLRIVVRDGHSLGDQLVADGVAHTWEGRRRPWCA